MRRFGEQRKKGQKYRLRPGAYAILPSAGHLLMTDQDLDIPEIQLPGGGIDPGESVLSALHREVFEETGWRIGFARRLTTYRRFVFMSEYDMWAEKICHIYEARPIRRIGAPGEADHVPVWLSAQNAMDVLVSPGDRAILANYLNGHYGRPALIG